ncbi:unnamed protein product [Polarella glacialis]|uniref:Uncharacterized protein n=1 Tax=Polarella glacialis TaxID=89957 RepID=A0A813H5U3_POLGL|nr:unnamed protein product [Polarella glacialis]
MREAQSLNARTALNLGSSGIVSANRERLWAILRSGMCNAITLNEAEALALCGEVGVREACVTLAQCCDLVVLTLGAKAGCTIFPS